MRQDESAAARSLTSSCDAFFAGHLEADAPAAHGQNNRALDWLETPPQSGLPTGFRLLCVAPHEPSWIALSLKLDAVGCHDARLRWVSTSAEAMTVLRNDVFDSIAICHESAAQSFEWDSINLLRAIRASGCDDAVVMLTPNTDDQLAIACYEERAELLVSPQLWGSRVLVAAIQQALRAVEMRRENHRLAVVSQRRLVRDRDEADHLLQQQRSIVRELELLTCRLSPDETAQVFEHESLVATNQAACVGRVPMTVPEEIKSFYQELLRTYVIMGSGSLGGEIAQLAQVLAKVGLSPRDTLSLHLERVEQLVSGLGNRSTRHVMGRADLLVLELIMHIGECYQQRNENS